MTFSIKVVDRESAVLPIKDSIAVSLHKNHVTMVKFSSETDPDYGMVRDTIKATIRDNMAVFSEKGWAHEDRLKRDSN